VFDLAAVVMGSLARRPPTETERAARDEVSCLEGL
jgi:hypothetical protein